jgi:hypothetical protein
MTLKQAVWFGMIVGSLFGQLLPMLWGDSMLSFSSIVLSTIFGIAGIWLAYKMFQGY